MTSKNKIGKPPRSIHVTVYGGEDALTGNLEMIRFSRSSRLRRLWWRITEFFWSHFLTWVFRRPK